MAEVIIRDVPAGAETAVKEMALVAIERFINSRDVKVAEGVEAKFKIDVDTVRVSNGLPKKYDETAVVKP